MSSTMYSILNKSSGIIIVWECMKCGMPNFSTSLFDTTASLETHNRFDSLSSLSDPESPIPDIIGPPTAASSPIVQGSVEAKGKATKAALNHPLRILIMNCQSIKNKKAELHTIIDLAKKDIILGNESWLIDGWLRMGLLPPPREFRRHILSCRELKAASFKRCLHSVLRGVSL